jgi:hypothetical protein
MEQDISISSLLHQENEREVYQSKLRIIITSFPFQSLYNPLSSHFIRSEL